MAAGILPIPGSPRGACKAACKHRDCAITRRMAGERCRFCSDPIGFETRFFTDPQNDRDVRGDTPESGPALVHAACLEAWYDGEIEDTAVQS